MRLLVLLLITFSLLQMATCRAIAQEPIEGQPAPEAKKFQGTWKLLSLTRDGKELPAPELANVQLVFAGNEFSYHARDGRANRATFKLSEKTTPGIFESTYVDGPDRGKSSLRIYEWQEGNKVRFCTPGPMEKMPTDFAAPFGSGRELAVWERVKKG